MFAVISTFSHKTLWTDFKIFLDIWLKTSSSFGFCDKDSIYSPSPSLHSSVTLGLIALLGVAILSFFSLSSLLPSVSSLLQLSPLHSSSMMELGCSNNESKLWSQPDLGLTSGLDIYKLGNLGQIY